MTLTQLRGSKKADFPEATDQDFEKIRKKNAEDLAESIEIMIVETRPLDYARVAMRGALCFLRNEPTNISRQHAIHALMKLKDRWDEQDWKTRSLIVRRALEIIQAGGLN